MYFLSDLDRGQFPPFGPAEAAWVHEPGAGRREETAGPGRQGQS